VGTTGGIGATGGSPIGTTGGVATTLGGSVGNGGLAATGGALSTAAAVTVNMVLTNLSSGTLQGNLEVTLPSGAAPILMSTLKLTLCGAGSGGAVQAAAMQIYDGRLTCPQAPNPTPDCSTGSSNTFQSTVKIGVSGTGPSCCFAFDFSAVPSSLGPGGNITLSYAQISTNGTVLKHESPQVWTAVVNGQPAAGICTIPAAPATSAVCG
jgi:hypothetical protein